MTFTPTAKRAGTPATSTCLVALAALLASPPAPAQWPQWGGPNRNFKLETAKLADSWPEAGPPRLWQRELGNGFSAIIADENRIYTLYRKPQDTEHACAIALDPTNGKTLWESQYHSPVPRGDPQFPGPNATPLLIEHRLIAVSANGLVLCFDKNSGRTLWERPLLGESNAIIPAWGYSPSPLAYEHIIIVPVGRPADDAQPQPAPRRSDEEGGSLVALHSASGQTVWKSQDFRIGHASPILIHFAGRDQAVLQTLQGVIGVDPKTGTLLWELTLPTGEETGVMASPAWNGKDLLFCTAEQDGCMIRLTEQAGKITPEKLWSSRKVGMGMGTPVCVGDLLIGPRLGQRPFMLGVDARTGERVWYSRSCPPGPFVYAGGKLIVVDQNGQLGLASASTEGLTLQAECKIADQYSFTAPTLIGTTLYLRDQRNILALDLR